MARAHTRSATQPIKIPDAEIPAIIERWRAGESLMQQAKRYGCSHQAMYKRVRLYCDSGRHDQAYADIVTDVYVLQALEDEEALRMATDAVAVTRATNLCKLSQWHKERRLSKLYGQRVEMQVSGPSTISLGVTLDVPHHIVDVSNPPLLEAPTPQDNSDSTDS